MNTGIGGGTITLYWYAPVNNGGVAISHYIVQARLTGNDADVDWADFADVDETTDLGNISGTAELNATADTPSYTIRIGAPDIDDTSDALVSQAEFTGATVDYDHDGDTGEDGATPEVTASWQFQVYTETTEPGVDGDVGLGNDDGDVRRSAASGTATSTAAARPLAMPTLLASGASPINAAGAAKEDEIELCVELPADVTNTPPYRIDASDDGGINWKLLIGNTRGTIFGACTQTRRYTDDGLGDRREQDLPGFRHWRPGKRACYWYDDGFCHAGESVRS